MPPGGRGYAGRGTVAARGLVRPLTTAIQKGPAQAGYTCLYPRALLRCHIRRWGLPRASQQPAGLLAARCGAPCGLRCPALASRFAARSPVPTAAPAPVSCFRRRRRRPSQLFAPSPRLYKSGPQAGYAWGPLLYAGGGGRTHTVSPPTDFESVSSASSNTPACNIGIINRLRPKVKPGARLLRRAPLARTARLCYNSILLSNLGF